jgi:hypothetical protein
MLIKHQTGKEEAFREEIYSGHMYEAGHLELSIGNFANSTYKIQQMNALAKFQEGLDFDNIDRGEGILLSLSSCKLASVAVRVAAAPAFDLSLEEFGIL